MVAGARLAARERKALLLEQAHEEEAIVGARLPVIAIVGRPNVGKSTLFNRLTKSRDALVADVPGLTRDRHYGRGKVGQRELIVIDTGGFEPVAKSGIAAEMAKQTRQAVREADIVIFVVDARDGRTPHDESIAAELRRADAHPVLAVNKAEGLPRDQTVADFYSLGLGQPVAISSAHGDGIRELIEMTLGPFDAAMRMAAQSNQGQSNQGQSDRAYVAEIRAAETRATETLIEPIAEENDASPRKPIRIAVVGRPNVGKSTMINTLLGEERLIAFDQPGTTRDSIEVDFIRQGRPYVLVDTAGVRRRGKVNETVEKFSVIKTLQAIDDCHVAILVMDANDSVSDQDANIAGYILESGRALVVALNKWDAVDTGLRERVHAEYQRKLHFLKFANMHFTSARDGSGIAALMKSVDAAYRAATIKLATPKLTRAILDAVQRQAPPRSGFSRPKLRYAHQGGQNPPIVVIHGTSLSDVKPVYTRFIEGWLRTKFDLTGTPLRIEYRSAVNPFADKEQG